MVIDYERVQPTVNSTHPQLDLSQKESQSTAFLHGFCSGFHPQAFALTSLRDGILPGNIPYKPHHESTGITYVQYCGPVYPSSRNSNSGSHIVWQVLTHWAVSLGPHTLVFRWVSRLFVEHCPLGYRVRNGMVS